MKEIKHPLFISLHKQNIQIIQVKGKCGVFKDGKQVRVLNAGESFGEQALISDNSVRQMTIKAVEGEAKVLALGRDMVQKLLGDQMQSIIYKNNCKWAIQKSKLFPNLSQPEIDKLLDGVQFKSFKIGQKVISKGTKIVQLAIVVEGVVTNAAKQKLASKEELINEELLMSNSVEYLEDAFMDQEGVIGFIDYQVFIKLQGSLEKQKQDKSQNASSAIKNEVQQKDLKDFQFLSKLGQGQFGSVFLVKLKGSPQLFALKYVTRAHIVQFGIQKHIQQEKAVLERMNHVFIMNFFRSYKDNENIYFLTEYIAGIELFDAIRLIGLLSKYDAQFYTSQMLLAMEYIHTVHRIVYRDIKPENLMVDDKGYLKLIDMGTAKELKNPKTFTIIGTPHYMAPEVISGKGYNFNADLWSIGVCLYEFICGGLPFGEEAEDPFEIYNEIVKKDISYPTYMSDKTAQPFIAQLMNKTPELRLGGSYSALKQHGWFKGWDFEALVAKSLKPPVLPPKDKVFTQAQIEHLEKKDILLVDQINKETAGQKKIQATAKDKEWDFVF